MLSSVAEMSCETPCGIGTGWEGVTQSMLTSFRNTWSISTAENQAHDWGVVRQLIVQID